MQLNSDKERIETELQLKEQRLQIEAKEKENLEAILREMEHKLVSGGHALEEKERE